MLLVVVLGVAVLVPVADETLRVEGVLVHVVCAKPIITN